MGDSSDEDDPLSLSSFKIPKQATSKELLQSHNVLPSSQVWEREVRPMITSSKRLPADCFVHSRLFTVNNEELERKYALRKAELRKILGCGKSSSAAFSSSEGSEIFAFFPYATLDEASEVCRNGPTIGNCSCSSLANSQMGITLFRHVDVLSSKSYTSADIGQSGFIVIFKIFTGRIRGVAFSSADPDPNYDCYVSAEHKSPDQSMTQLYNSSQLFLFQYDENYEIDKKPAHVLPYAIIDYKLAKLPPCLPSSLSSSLDNNNNAMISKKANNNNNNNKNVNSSDPAINNNTTTNNNNTVAKLNKRPIDGEAAKMVAASSLSKKLNRSGSAMAATEKPLLTLPPSHMMIPLGRGRHHHQELSKTKNQPGRPSL